MKYFVSQIAVFMSNSGNKRNMRFFMRFALGMLLLILLYSTLFHLLMIYEARDYSLLTGLYWTLTVMSTLGFGDITFSSDLGRLFTILVLLSGIIFFVVMLPFTFIHFFYQPWVEAQKQTKAPVALPEDTKNHVLLVGTGDISQNIQARLKQYNIASFMLTPDTTEAGELSDAGLPVMRGELDAASTYHAARVHAAAMVVALRDDLKNTNIAATVHGLAPETTLVSSARNENSIDILHFAGCKQVLHVGSLLGSAIGRRVFAGAPESNIIARFDELCIAEIPARSTSMVGKNLIELDLRAKMGINVVGIWHGTEFISTTPTTVVDAAAVLLLAGTADRLEHFDQVCVLHEPDELNDPVLVLGGGTVGHALTENLQKRGVPFRLVDKDPSRLQPGDTRYVLGDAEDIAVLRRAGIDKVESVAVTTHDDDLNIYLTLYCRKLRPEAQIISRCNLTRNIRSLYGAGASLVMSASSMFSNAVLNMLSPDSIYMLTEGMNIFRVTMPPALVGKNLRNSEIRRSTNCNVVAMRRDGKMLVGLDPDSPFMEKDELVLVGSVDAEHAFMARFPQEAASV